MKNMVFVDLRPSTEDKNTLQKVLEKKKKKKGLPNNMLKSYHPIS